MSYGRVGEDERQLCGSARLMDGVTRLWAMRRSKWDGADGGLCLRRVWVGAAYEEDGQHIYRRSGVWGGEAWVRNLGGLCLRRVWVGAALDGGRHGCEW